ncbi:MAG: S8 family serine peptidase [Candidatus Diapherotrites archaeon]|nr:S8 family serine peptidase [Candidatus Diapherotrites archaeon]
MRQESGGPGPNENIEGANGFIVEFYEAPLAVKYAELKEANENAEELFANATASENPEIFNAASARTTDIGAELRLHAQKIESQHEQAKTGILNALSKNSETPKTLAEISAQSTLGTPTLAILGEYSKTFNGIALDISQEDAEKILDLPGVKSVTPNTKSQMQLFQTIPIINADDVWALDIDGGQCASSGKECITGKGVKVGIMDTGIDYTHDDFGNCTTQQFTDGLCAKVAGGYDFVNEDNDPMDDQGHGTLVASVVAGNGGYESYDLNGVARDATLYALKVGNSQGSAYLSDVIEALDWALDPDNDGNFDDHLDVVNYSFGGNGNPDDTQNQAFDNIVRAGVVAVVSAGNAGSSPESMTSPGMGRKIISAGATWKDDEIASFSSRGPVKWIDSNGYDQYLVKPDVVAVGVNICVAKWSGDGGPYNCIPYFNDGKHSSFSGTSASAPVVAGAAALLKQKYPGWSPDEIKMALQNTAVDIGEPMNTQGHGRIDVLAAASLSGAPPIAEIHSFQPLNDTTANILGTATGDNFSGYTLYYHLNETDPWQTICNGSSQVPEEGLLCTFDFDAANTVNGDYGLKLVVNANGQQTTEYGGFTVNNIKTTSPLNNDIFRAGDVIDINGSVLGNFNGYTIEFAASPDFNFATDPNATWSNSGISLANNGLQPVENGTLATWDTSGLSGWYDMKITLERPQGNVDENIFHVYLDPTLKKGWPVKYGWYYYAPWDVYIVGGLFEPVVADLTNDGNKEIITAYVDNAQILAFKNDGSLLWSGYVYDYPQTIPTIGDIDGDGNKEIVVASNSYLSVLNNVGDLKFWQSSGNYYIPLPTDYKYTITLADLDNDGADEIIVKGNWPEGNVGVGGTEQMLVIDGNGTIRASWDLPQNPFAGNVAKIQSYPAVGNFDDDPELEIVSAQQTGDSEYSDSGAIYVYNMDGSVVDGWPVSIPSAIFASPSVGDIDNDGNLEIVVGAMGRNAGEWYNYSTDYGGIYAFDANGSLVPGWPVLKGLSFEATPALGDIDHDGFLEIAATSNYNYYAGQPKTHLLRANGETVSGWPQEINWNANYGVIMADIDSDNAPEILVSAGNAFQPNKESHGGIYAWNTDGSSVNGFPKGIEGQKHPVGTYPEKSIRYSPAPIVDDIDNDGKVELIAGYKDDYDFFNQESKHRGSIYAWDLDGDYNAANMPWPMFGHDTGHTGRYVAPPKPPPSVERGFEHIAGSPNFSLSFSVGGSMPQVSSQSFLLAPFSVVLQTFRGVYSGWENAAYSYKKPIFVSVKSEALDANYTFSDLSETTMQEEITLDTQSLVAAGKMQTGCDDLRVYDENLHIELDRQVAGCNTASTKVVVQLKSAWQANTNYDGVLAIYYGNPSASSPPSDMRKIYSYWLDFEDAYVSDWTLGDGSITAIQKISGAYSANLQNSSNAYKQSIPSMPDGKRHRYSYAIQADGISNGSLVDLMGASDTALCMRCLGIGDNKFLANTGGNWANMNDGGNMPSANTNYLAAMDYANGGTSMNYFIWNETGTSLLASLLNQTVSAKTIARIGARGYNGSGNAYFDNFRAQPAVYDLPVVSVGEEQAKT